MVRLRDPNPGAGEGSSEEFQFQYGAIESLFVRYLRQHYSSVSIPIWCDWEDSSNLPPSSTIWSFNSNMVRLRDEYGFETDACFQFQFQYGAIESWRYCSFSINLFFVSIPIWCDWELFTEKTLLKKTCFNSNMVRLREIRRLTTSL